MQEEFVYDIETYKNMFSVGFVHKASGTRWIYEVSERRNQSLQLGNFIRWLVSIKARLTGFNNEGFDWYVMQKLIQMGTFTAEDAYQLGQAIINAESRFGMTIWPNERIVPQLDLYKIHHFDNMSKSTSLKKLEINMRAHKVIDLPYSPHELLTYAQMDDVIAYMCHDIDQTLHFRNYSEDQVAFRDALAIKYPNMGDVVNFNDTKIGKKFFEQELERVSPGCCYHYVDRRRVMRQTKRTEIKLADVISPKIQFQHPEFHRIHQWMLTQTLHGKQIEDSLTATAPDAVETKGVFKGLTATVNGFTFVYGTGGLHGSLDRVIIRETDLDEIVDVDVKSFYPNLAIVNKWYPLHLGEQFSVIYKVVYDMRQEYDKKTAENAMLKLALNGVYGSSNDKYSPFLDAAFTMSITLNGQLFLSMLAEQLMTRGFKIIQANTDGLTFVVPRARRGEFDAVCNWWQGYTGLELEDVAYSAMMVRDVNSYMAVKRKDGSVKRIGAYAYVTPMEDPFTRELMWHKDHSMRVVAMAAEAEMVRGIPVTDFIMNHRDPFDFMLSVKVPKSSRLEANGVPIQKTSRYYISTDGVELIKIMPPLKDQTEERHFQVQKGWTTTLVNDADLFRWDNLNWYYYIEQARKLLI